MEKWDTQNKAYTKVVCGKWKKKEKLDPFLLSHFLLTHTLTITEYDDRGGGEEKKWGKSLQWEKMDWTNIGKGEKKTLPPSLGMLFFALNVCGAA